MSRRRRNRLHDIGVQVFHAERTRTVVAKEQERPASGQAPAQEPKTKDKRMMGFFFPLAKDKTPRDYAVDSKTGMRPSAFTGAYGVSLHDLCCGVHDTVIPSLAIWENGIWLTDIEEYWRPISECHPNRSGYDKRINYDKRVWITHGEGTPGNFAFHGYLVPKEIAEDVKPKHPLLWRKFLQDGKTEGFTAKRSPIWVSSPDDPFLAHHTSWMIVRTGSVDINKLPNYPKGYTTRSGGQKVKEWQKEADEAEDREWRHTYGLGFRSTTPAPRALTPQRPVTPAAPAAPKAPTLPTGTRMRHQCGHWFTMTGLIDHAKVCAIDNQEGVEAYMAIECDKMCGCEYIEGFPSAAHALGVKTLDHVSRCKPGYEPKPKEEVQKVNTVAEPEPEPKEGEDEGEETDKPEPQAEPAE